MTEAEKAAKRARDYFASAIVFFVIAATLHILGFTLQPSSTTMSSQRSLAAVSVIVGCNAWIFMMMAYRKLLWARRVESEALKSLLDPGIKPPRSA